MFWTVEKLQARIRDLEPFRYRDAFAIEPLKMKTDADGAVGTYPDDGGEWEEVRLGFRWQGRDEYRWLAADAAVPAAWSGKPVVALLDLGQSGGNGNSGFEALLFVDGRPYQGVDNNHREAFLPDDAPGRTVRLRLRLWSGLGGYRSAEIQEHRLQQAALAWLDESADDLYYTAKAALETAMQLTGSEPERHDLLRLVDRAFLRIDWSRPGSGGFYASLAEAAAQLRSGLADKPKRHAVTVRCIGHTHIDVAWLWRLRHTREKAARSFSTVLRLMERYPEYVFLQTQPQLYEYIQADYPELYAEIRTRAAEGRWEPGGAMWLEADCNLTNGESLVRHLLYGERFFRKEFGTECKYLWLPDVFGYSWALPQILRKAGIEAFMTTKISWNQYNRMPNDTFYWRGIDGSEILTHFITTPNPGDSDGLGAFYYTYNGAITPKTVQGIWDAYRDKELNRELLLAYGYGDGGGGVNREMLEMRRRLADMPGLPHVTTGRADAYFHDLAERVAASDSYVHTWDGELYLELHRGTYTSQAFIKRMNRKLELLYREAEWLSVLGALQAGWGSYPAEELYEGWKIILRNQFHDIIPGSSIREVYEDAREEYAQAWQLGVDARQRAIDSLTAAGPGQKGGGGEWTVCNGSSWPRTDLAVIPALAGMEAGRWTDAAGCALAAERIGTDWHVLVREVPPMGLALIRFEPDGPGPGSDSGLSEPSEVQPPAIVPFAADGNQLETPFYTLEWNAFGQLTRLHDKIAGREVFPAGTAANVLQVFEDKPKSRHEAWDIDLYYMQKQRTVTELRAVRAVHLGSLQAIVEFEWTYMDSTIRQRMIAYAHSRRLDFVTEADWHEQRQLLKAAFPVDIRATEATYDIQFGNVKRPTHWNTSWDYARFETVGHQWADLAEAGYGVSLLNDCKYGYDIKDNVMRLSLIKSALVPDDQADQGAHAFTYSLLPHAGDWRDGGTVHEAWALNAPLSAYPGAPKQGASFACFRLSAPERVMIDAVKKGEDSRDVILRLHEYAGARGEVGLASDWPIAEWQETDLLERPVGECREGGELRFALSPYEIRTFRIRFLER